MTVMATEIKPSTRRTEGVRVKGRAARVVTDVLTATAEELSELLVNDLEPAAFHLAPWLEELKGRVEEIAGRRVHMTGSGSTLFVLSSTGAEAGRLEAKLTGALGVGEGMGCNAVRVLRT